MKSTGNRVNNIVVAVSSDRWLLHILWWSLCEVRKGSLGCALGTNVILHANSS